MTYALPGLVSVGFAVFAAFSKRADRAGILFGGAAADFSAAARFF